MTALHMIWASSAAGAAIFFALGYVVRILVRTAPEVSPGGAGGLAGGGAEALAELDRLRQTAETTERARAELARQLEARAAESRSTIDELARLKDALAHAEAALAKRKPGAASAPPPAPSASGDDDDTKVDGRSAELVSVSVERTALRQRVEELEAGLEAATAAKQEIDSALALARAENEGLSRKLANAERASQREAERRSKAEKERLEAKAELATVRAEMKAMEEARGSLAQSIASGKDPRGASQALREENAELRLEVDRRARAAEQLESMRTARDKAERSLREAETELHSLRAEAGRADEARRRLEAVERETARLRDAGARADAAEEELRRVKQDVDSLRRDIRDAQARARDAAGRGGEDQAQLDKARAEATALQLEVKRAENRLAELDLLREENQRLRVELAELERLRRDPAELERLQAETSQLRVQTEVHRRKAEEIEAIAAERAALRDQVVEMKGRLEELDRVRERVGSLEAQLFAAGIEPKRERGKEVGGGERVSYVGLDVALSSLAAVANLRAAVVADDMGLVIAGAGREEYHEDVAALSGLARHMAERAQDLLPLDDIQQIVLEDANQVILTCRLFKTEENDLALSMLGTKVPPPKDLIDKHVRSLLKNLG